MTAVEDRRKSFARRAESLVERVRIMRTIYEVSHKTKPQMFVQKYQLCTYFH